MAPARAIDICKWFDRTGQAHYGDAPPSGQACTAVIRIGQLDPVERQQAEERRTRLLQQLKDAEEVSKAQRKKGQVAREERSTAERAARCELAQDELKFLQAAQGMRLVRPARSDELGPMVWIDDDEREALLQAWQVQVQRWCAQSVDAPPADAARPDVPPPYGVPPPPRRPS